MPQDLNSPSITQVLALARVVKTQSGSSRYGQPVGSQIVRDAPKAAAQGAVTPSRLRSLYAQVTAANAVGDVARVKQLQADLKRAVLSYAATSGSIVSALNVAKGPQGAED